MNFDHQIISNDTLASMSDAELLSIYYELDKTIKNNAWQHFVNYNIIDTELVTELEDKLGLVYLAVTLAYLTKVNFDDVFSPVKTWESYILSTLLEENTFCELRSHSSSDHQIVGGYVKDVVPGIYNWTVGYDCASMYPSIIMSNNMSPETIVDMVEVDTIDNMLLGKLPKVDEKYTICTNGARFRKDILGVMPRLTDHVFESRKTAKKKMLSLKKEYEKVEAELKRRGVYTH